MDASSLRYIQHGHKRSDARGGQFLQKKPGISKGFFVSGSDERAELFAADDADDIALLAHAEDHHGHVVVFAERYSGRVHDAESSRMMSL